MANTWRYCIFLALISCNTAKNPFLSGATPHEQYRNSLRNAGLTESKLGRMWLKAARRAMDSPVVVSVPFSETAYFSGDAPTAAGYAFDVKQGEKIHITLSAKKDSATQLFAEVYKLSENDTNLLEPIQSLQDTLRQVIKRDGRFLIRVQPELLANLEYTLQIFSGPSLAFPVDSSGNPRYLSYWGAGRDGGRRKHEGIDIGARFRTPVLAAANGTIARTGNNRLGGKVVFLRDKETGNSLYYAHLDSQIALRGERVRVGDTIGLIGNTGNAIHTPPHLHFGIYTINGAVNPFAFIDRDIESPPALRVSSKHFATWKSVATSTPLLHAPNQKAGAVATLQSNEPVFIHGGAGDYFRVSTHTGRQGYLPARVVTSPSTSTKTANEPVIVFDNPGLQALPKGKIEMGTSYRVIGAVNGFRLIAAQNLQGWIQ